MTALPRSMPRLESVSFSPESDRPSVSVVVLVSEPSDELLTLYEELKAAVVSRCPHPEFIFVVEPPFAGSTAHVQARAHLGEPIRILSVGQVRGEAALLRVGLLQCRGAIILTVPAGRRIESSAVANLLDAMEAGADLAVARRWPRRDPWFIQMQTRAFHRLAGGVMGAGSPVSDVACGVRAMRRELLDRMPLYGDLALFLPMLAARDGYSVVEVPAPQHAANRRRRTHSPALYVRRLFDLLGLFFLVRFTEKPLRFFGSVGAAAAVPGVALLSIVALQRMSGQGMADRPLMLLGLLCLVLGVQAIALGLIGEIIVHLHASPGTSYRLRGEPGSADAPL